jgi:hypothetical protein
MSTIAGVVERMYEGRRVRQVAYVDVVEGSRRWPLNARIDLVQKCPALDWGFFGNGPTQLALALIADATNDDQKALRHMEAFKQRIVASLPRPRFTLSRETVLLVLTAIENDSTRAARHIFNRNKQPGARRR